MKSALFLMFMLLSTSAFAEAIAGQEEYAYKNLVQSAETNEDEIASMREFVEWNGNATDNYRDFVIEARAFHRSYYIMKGLPQPTRGPKNWVPCTRNMLSPTPVAGWIQTPRGWYRNPSYRVQPGGRLCADV